jgi:hypothetical protein
VTSESIISQAKYPWIKRILVPYVVLFTFIALIAGADYFLIVTVILIFLGHYLLFEQFHFVDHFLTEKALIVHYPISFTQKSKSFTLTEIEKIEFNFHPPMYGSPYCKLFITNGNVEKVFCSGITDMSQLIQGLQQMNVTIEVLGDRK